MVAEHGLICRVNRAGDVGIAVDPHPVHFPGCGGPRSRPTTGTLFSAWQATTQAEQPVHRARSMTIPQPLTGVRVIVRPESHVVRALRLASRSEDSPGRPATWSIGSSAAAGAWCGQSPGHRDLVVLLRTRQGVFLIRPARVTRRS